MTTLHPVAIVDGLIDEVLIWILDNHSKEENRQVLVNVDGKRPRMSFIISASVDFQEQSIYLGGVRDDSIRNLINVTKEKFGNLIEKLDITSQEQLKTRHVRHIMIADKSFVILSRTALVRS